MSATVLSDLTKTLKTSFNIKLAALNAAGLTAARTHTLQDRAGTLAHLDQVLHGEPAGRITLESGVAVSPTDQSAKTNIYYTPYVGETVPIYNGSTWTPTVFTELTQALATSGTGFQSADFNYDLFVANDAGTLRLGTGPAWTRAATVTISNASPGVITWTAHGLGPTFSVVFTTTGALPTGLTAGTTYYVKTVLTANTFTVAATPGGTDINTSSAGSGTHTGTESNTVRGTGAGTTELERKNGIWTNKNSMTLRWGSASGNTITVAANLGTYVGTMRASASGQCEDSLTKRFLWNTYHRVARPMSRLESTNSWTYSSAAWRQMNGSVLNQLGMVRGLNEDSAIATAAALVESSVSRGVKNGIGINAVDAFASACLPGHLVVGTSVQQMTSAYHGAPGLGYHFLAALEYGHASDTQTWYGDIGAPLTFQTGINAEIFA